MKRGGAARWQSEMAKRGGEARWRSEVARRGDEARWCGHIAANQCSSLFRDLIKESSERTPLLPKGVLSSFKKA